jgi:hypothetical protein
MTAKQRAARAKFKAVVAEAKKLRKKNPKLTQAQAVKQAFAISYSKQRAGKKVGAAPKKKAATRVKAKKSKRTSEMHTDTKSHNVNIRVMSGFRNDTLKKIDEAKNTIIKQSELLEKLKNAYKNSKSKENRSLLMQDIRNLKNNFIPHNKRYLKSLQNSFKKSI